MVAIFRCALFNDIGLSPTPLKLVVKQILYYEIVFTISGIMDWKYSLRNFFGLDMKCKTKQNSKDKIFYCLLETYIT